MKFSTLACLAGAFSVSVALAEQPDLVPTPTVSADDNYTSTAPEVALKEYLEHGNKLALRQVGAGNLNGAATTAATQAGATTTFYMASAIGTTDTWVPFTYVQTFAAVPDQWPSPVAGEIGLGTLVKQQKRDAEPTPAGFEVGSPLVLEMHNVVVTQPVKPVMEVEEVIEVPPGYGISDGTFYSIQATAALNQTTMGTGNMTNTTANMTATVNITSTYSARILPSQMDPEFVHPPLTTSP